MYSPRMSEDRYAVTAVGPDGQLLRAEVEVMNPPGQSFLPASSLDHLPFGQEAVNDWHGSSDFREYMVGELVVRVPPNSDQIRHDQASEQAALELDQRMTALLTPSDTSSRIDEL